MFVDQGITKLYDFLTSFICRITSVKWIRTLYFDEILDIFLYYNDPGSVKEDRND
jgi:hypothetical protein